MDEWRNPKLPERLPFSKKRLSKRVIFSYISDYVIIVALAALFVLVDKIEPFHQPFELTNYTLHYPYAKKERVTVNMAGIIAIGGPMVVIVFYTMIIDGLFSHKTSMPAGRSGVKRLTGRYRLKDRLWELNCGLLGLFLAVSAAFSITGSLKNAIGKPRPDIIDRCIVDEVKAEVVSKGRQLATIALCKQDDQHILQDGFKSFPSAHSSVSFGGLFYLSLYLAAKLHILDSKGEVWKAVIVVVPTIGAALIAGSRIMDARHHPFDVITGSLLGILVAWGAYRQYFPPITETWRKGRAYPIRSWGSGPEPPSTRLATGEDAEPLRSAPLDVERGDASGFSTNPVASGGNGGGNVFREQINQSQRRRQQEGQFSLQPSDTMESTYSQNSNGYRNQAPISTPYNNPRRPDNYDYSSSEDDQDYELQQRQPRSAVAYNPVTGHTDTGYHPPSGVSPSPTPPPPASFGNAPAQRTRTGDIAAARKDSMPMAAPAPAPPPHASGTMAQAF
ncbi:unnamed protein product [Periconia digitata]|uniref:Phosphatidic acid phosphatase type 2/haloperoxidase domain-containing protein n=1 Tax=Periconia digitata TaxID=1303443 RepID=A0A9W4UGS6_9PLEO|nr:unnamed protein product [Periconia digitata]